MKSNIHGIAASSHGVESDLYVIATRGRGNKEIYLKCSDKETSTGRILLEWTENIDEAMATFSYSEIEDCAKRYFKNYTKWYIKKYIGIF
jgi:hypothetical protein